mmetsp:Transcript_24331/g.36910  ORF Transcript_24331/g.36910 Transcript_24331/m.36910 type:complete len:262 (-) Transcript_24331:249-1034(-)
MLKRPLLETLQGCASATLSYLCGHTQLPVCVCVCAWWNHCGSPVKNAVRAHVPKSSAHECEKKLWGPRVAPRQDLSGSDLVQKAESQPPPPSVRPSVCRSGSIRPSLLQDLLANALRFSDYVSSSLLKWLGNGELRGQEFCILFHELMATLRKGIQGCLVAIQEVIEHHTLREVQLLKIGRSGLGCTIADGVVCANHVHDEAWQVKQLPNALLGKLRTVELLQGLFARIPPLFHSRRQGRFHLRQDIFRWHGGLKPVWPRV